MKALLRAVILIPVAVALLGFAVANRSVVSVKLDPFDLIEPAVVFDVPLFLPVFLSLMIGILAGGCAMWLSQGRHRRAVRMHLRTIELLRRQSEDRNTPRNSPSLPPASFVG